MTGTGGSFPLTLRIAGRKVVVVGGGHVATRRTHALVDAGAELTIVSPTLSARLAELAEQGRIHWEQRGYQDGDLDGAWLVQTATADEATDDRVAATIVEAGRAAEDPFWTMPLWPGYDAQLNSRITDMNNTGSGGHSGSIVAALFLRRFVTNAAVWTHLDIFGWTNEARPGRPVGGTDQGIRAIYGLLRQRYPA